MTIKYSEFGTPVSKKEHTPSTFFMLRAEELML
jgi:hypothetical protein